MVDPYAAYAVLELAPGAGEASVRAAYRRLARRFHPDVDRASGATARMREINAAYALLIARLDETPAVQLSTPRSVGQYETAHPAPSDHRAAQGAERDRTGWYASASSAARAATTPPADSKMNAAPAAGASAGIGVMAATRRPHAQHTLTIGAVAGLVALVGVFAGWAFVVSRPAGPVLSAVRPIAAASQTQAASPTVAPAGGRTAAVSNATRSTAPTGAIVDSPEQGVPPASASGPATGPRDFQVPLPPLQVPGTTAGQPVASRPVSADAEAQQAASPVSQAAAPIQREIQPAAGAAGVVSTGTGKGGVQAPAGAQVPAIQHPQSAQGAPVAPARAPHIQAVASQQVAEPASPGAAARALSAYDRAWTNYATAVRFAAAGTLVPATGPAAAPNVGAAALLSSDGQLGLFYGLYLDARGAWNRQMANTLDTLAQTGAVAAVEVRPDGDTEARATQRLRQAAGLVSQAQSSGRPVPVAEVKSLLDEAEQLHRVSVADWAGFVAACAGLAGPAA
jgi:hypothetical protein